MSFVETDGLCAASKAESPAGSKEESRPDRAFLARSNVLPASCRQKAWSARLRAKVQWPTLPPSPFASKMLAAR